jgi:hypothetical protein
MGGRWARGAIIQSVWSLLRAKEGGRLQAKFFLLRERMGATRSAVDMSEEGGLRK